jgi:hypothetical protein
VAERNLDPSTLRADALSAAGDPDADVQKWERHEDADRAASPPTDLYYEAGYARGYPRGFAWGIEGHRGTGRGQPSSVDMGAGLLTADEHEAIDLTGQLANLMGRIVGEGPTRTGDLNEVVQRIQAIQHMILAQAAARAYPDRYRLLGGTFNEPSGA